ncbi:FHA domain-containing protein [Sarocladium implicatum]|nr:FHA domain-containing protein [Sarocladium implicatum]
MAEFMPKNHDEVLVTLSDKTPGNPKHALRRIVLTSDVKTRPIGRSSVRSGADLAASANNAWFDNAVMSRTHANLIWDPATQLVFICDAESRHGSTYNGFKLYAGIKQRLSAGDILGFGGVVEKDSKSFRPTEVQISSIVLGPPQLPPSDARTNTFTVPDDSEVEDFSVDEDFHSDSDDGGVSHSVMLLQQDKVTPPKEQSGKAETTTIDLTIDVQDEDADEALEDPILDFDCTALDASHASARTSSPSPADSTPPIAEIDDTLATTFAPALPQLDESSRAQDNNEIAEAHNAQLDLESGSQDKMVAHGREVDDSDKLDFPTSKIPAVSVSSPVTVQERANRLATQARERILKRMSEEKHTSADQMNSELHNTPMDNGLWMQYRQQTTVPLRSDTQYRIAGKRKFADFEVPEPSLAGLHNNSSDTDQPGPLTMSQIISNLRSGAASPPSQPQSLHQTTSRGSVAPIAVAPTSISPVDVASLQTSNEASSRISETAAQRGPPRKRIRRVAEAMGYAALGGIAVMSALIATAPDV